MSRAAGVYFLFLILTVSHCYLSIHAKPPVMLPWPGRFSFALPMEISGSAAMPSRLAMEISGKLMEGEVVNRSKAQRVYRSLGGIDFFRQVAVDEIPESSKGVKFEPLNHQQTQGLKFDAFGGCRYEYV